MSEELPTQIIILGGGGDLAQRKLLPALFDLFVQQELPASMRIIGIARTTRSHDEYRSLVKSAIILQRTNHDPVQLDSFCSHITYMAGSFDDEKSYEALLNYTKEFEQEVNKPSNKLIYLAVPPEHYKAIFTYLHSSSLGLQKKERNTWTRILVEKPFGDNYDTALELDSMLCGFFAEDQIFRIDHYLAKEAVQNILSFRFANTFFRSAWNKEHIKEVRITMHESVNAEARGAFYDAVGALRDVGQNHLLQVLALICMEEPAAFDADSIRSCRASILSKLVPITSKTVDLSVVRAQYTGYTETKGVRNDSTTETYFEFQAEIDSDTWRGVPFYARAGKALKNEQVVVEIVFHEVEIGSFKTLCNRIILTVSPVQSMNITLNVKKPGYGYELEPNTLSFAWDAENNKTFNAYSKVLLDCIEGDQTLFTKTAEVLSSWKFINSITDNWSRVPLQTYEPGSSGPAQSLFKD